MKNCKKCKQDKDLSEYYKSHKGKYYSPWCKNCSKQKNKQYRIDHPEKYRQYNKKFRQDNPDYQKQYYQDNKEQFSQCRNKNNQSIPPGIYGIYEHDQLIYIGESAKPYARIAIHFSNTTNLDNGSPVAQNIGAGILQRKNLSFKMLEYVDDDNARRQRETVLIQHYQPKYNNHYVNA
jgi:hypothetical protein